MDDRRSVPFVAAALLAVAGFTSPVALGAQLANASAATLGRSGNATATARGFEALSVNPAGLAMEGSGFSLALVPVQVRSALAPVTLSDLRDVQGSVVPDATREQWFDAVRTEGGQTGSVGFDVSGAALTWGRVGVQISTVGSGRMKLPPGAVEALLYGNAGRSGAPRDLELADAALDGVVATTAGVGLGVPLAGMGGEMAVGATLKYTVGHLVVSGRSERGVIRSGPVAVDLEFPMVHTAEDHVGDVDNGKGVGLDVGFMLRRDDLRLGVAVVDLASTFEWEEATLAFIPGIADLTRDSRTSDFEEKPFHRAPASVQERMRQRTFRPSLRLGAAYELTGRWSVSADLHNRFGEGRIAPSPDFHLGAAAEWQALDMVRLRGGAAKITGGLQYGGGATLVFGPLHLSGALLARDQDLDRGTIGQLTVSMGDH